MDQLLTVKQVVDELDDSERRRLLYLCEILDTDVSATSLQEMLGRKVLNPDMGQLLLKELLVQLRRFDILRKVCKTSRAEAERTLSTRHFVPTFRVLMADISQDLSTENLKNIKFLLSTELTRETLVKAKSFLDVAIELEKLDMVSSQSVDLVEECLKSIGRWDLAKKVAAYKNSAATPGQSSQQPRSRTSDPSLAANNLHHAIKEEQYPCRAKKGPAADPDMDQLLTVKQVVDELDDSERRRLLYLCEILDTNVSATSLQEMLGRKVLNPDMGQLLLKELLVQLRRFDILRKVCKTSRAEAERTLSTRHFVPTFRVLMADISQDLSTENLKNIKFLLSTELTRETLVKAKSFLDVAIELEKLDMVSSQSVDLVEECLKSIGRWDLAKKVAAYKNSAATPGQSSQQPRSRTSGPSLAANNQHHAIKEEQYPCRAKKAVTESVPISASRDQSFQNQLDCYRISSNPRGVCLIIDCVGNDGDLLEQTFKALHFHVVIHKWLSACQILTALEEIVRQREHTEADVFACCIISRGTSNHLLGTDSWIIGLPVDSIRRLLAAHGCPALADKPKLFFLQKYNVPEFQVNNGRDHRDEDLETDGFGSAATGSSIHEDADFFWSHCWTDERQLEEEYHCSVYVRALTDALLKGQRRETQLTDVHTEVNKAIFEHNSRNPGATYNVEVMHTLQKNLYL